MPASNHTVTGSPTAEVRRSRGADIRQMIVATTLVVAILAGFMLVYRFHQVLLFVVVGILLATAVSPLVSWLTRHKVPRILSIGGVYLALLILVGGILSVIVPMVVGQTVSLLEDMPEMWAQARTFLTESESGILQRLGTSLPENARRLQTTAESESEALDTLLNVGVILQSTLWGLFIFISVFLVGIFWNLEGERTIRYVLFVVPPDRRETASEIIDEIFMRLGAFIRGQGLLCLIVGGMALVLYWYLDLPYAVALAVIAGVLEAIPVFGPVLGAIPAILIGLTVDVWTAVWVTVGNIVIAYTESYLLVPRVMDRSVGLRPVVTLLSIVGLVALLGPLGGILAIPLAAILQVLMHRFVFSKSLEDKDVVRGRDSVSVLQRDAEELARDVRSRSLISEHDDEQEVDSTAEQIELIASRLSYKLQCVIAREHGQ